MTRRNVEPGYRREHLDMPRVTVANAGRIVNCFAASSRLFRIGTDVKRLRVVLPALLFLSIAVLSITRVDDPDAWTHLALGRDIVQRGGFPTHEPLSFP